MLDFCTHNPTEVCKGVRAPRDPGPDGCHCGRIAWKVLTKSDLTTKRGKLTPMNVAADMLPPRVSGWATQLAARFGRPVFLVGSALKLPSPRDYDVRIVLSNDEFQNRYGDPSLYERSCWVPGFFPTMRGYFEDMAKLARQGVEAIQLNLDLQVHPLRFAYRYRDEARLRLDKIEGLEDLFEVKSEPKLEIPKNGAGK